MRKIISTGLGLLALAAAMQSATAADLPRKAVYKAPIVDPWSWTGFYAGVNIGYSWGRSNTDISLAGAGQAIVVNYATNSSFDMNGVIGGGQIGHNWQYGSWVGGIEADIQGSGQKGSTAFVCPPGFGIRCTNADVAAARQIVSGTLEQKLTWFGTLRGRLGPTLSPSIWAYVTGGLAYGEIKTSGTLSGLDAGGPPVGVAFDNSVVKLGWTVGVGVEGRLWGNWTGKIEYLYMDLGTVSNTVFFPTNAPPLTATYSSRITDNILRVGINYKFDDRVVAKF